MTLVEVLISVAILAIGAVLIMQALARGAFAQALAQHRATAYAFAAAKLADLEMIAAAGAIPASSGRFWAGQDAFEWQVGAAPLDDAPELQLLTLTVSWRQGRHRYESSYSVVQRAPEPPPI